MKHSKAYPYLKALLAALIEAAPNWAKAPGKFVETLAGELKDKGEDEVRKLGQEVEGISKAELRAIIKEAGCEVEEKIDSVVEAVESIPEILRVVNFRFDRVDEKNEEIIALIEKLSAQWHGKFNIGKQEAKTIYTAETIHIHGVAEQTPAPVPDLLKQQIMLSKLPVTDSELFGRDEELALLDEAWEDEKCKVFVFVAWGGVGKSALVNEWLNRMSDDGFRGAKRVYGWSFYSQGTKEQGGATSDGFIIDALKWFGDEGMALSKKTGREKALRLVELIRKERTLLVLDGLEPLQYPPGPMGGRLKDEAVSIILRNLAKSNPGLCVVTTREEVKDVEGAVGHGVRRVDLESLSKEAGAEVLRNKGVVGTDKELEDTSKEFGGHALALNLLGSYLAVVHKGEVRKKDLVPALTDEEEKGGHARRVMESYEIWLKGSAELDILNLMGLFDRPAGIGAVDVLRGGDVIAGLNDELVGLDEAKWKYALKYLRDLGLLAKEDGEGDEGGAVLDCHPLVREHFGAKLKKDTPEAWRAGHERLYEYYKGLPEKLYGKELPDTVEEMEPLFRAVYHGCQTGKVQETFYDVYWDRIQQGNSKHAETKLGIFGSLLGAISNFIPKLWDGPETNLNDSAKAFVLNQAGFFLRAVGRLNEAAEPMKAGTKLRVKQEKWENAASAAGNVSELYLALGDVGKAEAFGERAIEYADKSGDEGQRVNSRTVYGDALHQAGDVEGAKELFREAERMQAEWQRSYPLLYSLRGYQYSDLLGGEGECENVLERARQTLEWAKQAQEASLLDIALGSLSIGRALMGLAVRDGGDWDEVGEWLDKAVDGLRAAGEQEFIVCGLLGRAAMYRCRGMYDEAWRDLEEAFEIAERGGMKLHLVDYHLEAGRVCVAQGDTERAKEFYEAARLLIEETGYHRRDGERFK